MKDPVVADSTCLIALERIDSLEVLPALFEPVLIPPGVDREFGVVPPVAQGRNTGERGVGELPRAAGGQTARRRRLLWQTSADRE